MRFLPLMLIIGFAPPSKAATDATCKALKDTVIQALDMGDSSTNLYSLYKKTEYDDVSQLRASVQSAVDLEEKFKSDNAEEKLLGSSLAKKYESLLDQQSSLTQISSYILQVKADLESGALPKSTQSNLRELKAKAESDLAARRRELVKAIRNFDDELSGRGLKLYVKMNRDLQSFIKVSEVNTANVDEIEMIVGQRTESSVDPVSNLRFEQYYNRAFHDHQSITDSMFALELKSTEGLSAELIRLTDSNQKAVQTTLEYLEDKTMVGAGLRDRESLYISLLRRYPGDSGLTAELKKVQAEIAEKQNNKPIFLKAHKIYQNLNQKNLNFFSKNGRLIGIGLPIQGYLHTLKVDRDCKILINGNRLGCDDAERSNTPLCKAVVNPSKGGASAKGQAR